jgi:hypothetical protein
VRRKLAFACSSSTCSWKRLAGPLPRGARAAKSSQVERGPAPNAGIGFGVCPLKVVRSRGAYLNLACTMAWFLLHARIR